MWGSRNRRLSGSAVVLLKAEAPGFTRSPTLPLGPLSLPAVPSACTAYSGRLFTRTQPFTPESRKDYSFFLCKQIPFTSVSIYRIIFFETLIESAFFFFDSQKLRVFFFGLNCTYIEIKIQTVEPRHPERPLCYAACVMKWSGVSGTMCDLLFLRLLIVYRALTC